MFKRILIFASALLVLVSAVVINLAILDIIPMQELRESLRKLLAVTAVSTIAILLIHKLFRLASPEAPGKNSNSMPISTPATKEEKPGQSEG